MTTRPRILLFFEALLAGAGAAALLHALLFPGLAGFSWLDGKLIVLLFSDLGAAMLLGILWMVLPRPAPADPAAGFWAGFGLGLAPLLISWGFSLLPGVGSPSRNGLLLEIAPPLLGLPLTFLLCRFLSRRLLHAPPAGVREGMALFAAGLELVLFLGVGVVPKHQVFDPLPAPPPGLAAPGSGPDVVLISIDTLRADALTDGRIALPSVERLRRMGMAAPFGLAPAPMTLPSHASMLSGISPFHHGADTNMSAVPGDLPMLAEHFRQHGWRTAAVVSNGVLRSNNGFGRGFESFTNLGRRPEALSVPRHRVVRVVARFGSWAGWLLPGALTGRITDALMNRRRDDLELGKLGQERKLGWETLEYGEHLYDQLAEGPAPFFLFLHFIDPHYPYEPDPSVQDAVPHALPLAQRYRDLAPRSGQRVKQMEKDFQAGRPEARDGAAWLKDLYLEEVLFIDHCLGGILDRLQESGRPTVILFTGDHGEQFGEHGLLGHGNSLYEPLLEVPFLLAGPGVPAGASFGRPPRLEDVPPTLLALAGLPVPDRFDGRPLLSASAPPALPQTGWMREGPRHLFSLRDGDWKLIVAFDPAAPLGSRVEARELHDLTADPGETRNLLSERPGQASRMLEQARKLLASARQGEDRLLDLEDKKILEELGYLEAQ